MSFKEQLQKLKENWLLIVLGLIILFALFSVVGGGINLNAGYSRDSAMEYSMYDRSPQKGGMYNTNQYNQTQTGDFSPEIEIRQIVKNLNLRLETKVGKFDEIDTRIKSIANTSNSYILLENTTSRKSGSKNIYTGNYTIKVDSTKLDDMVLQLKDLGTVISLNQSATDVTGSYTKTEVEIEIEKDRLKRYLEIYETTNEDGKLKLIDKIFNQERRIKYLEDSLKNLDQRVEYSTITLTVFEKYNYSNIVFVKFSELVRTLVNGINTVLKIIFGVIPYAVFAYLIYLFTRLFKRRKREDLTIKKK
jgi:hypothetical protein